jgi:hypothetical protein
MKTERFACWEPLKKRLKKMVLWLPNARDKTACHVKLADLDEQLGMKDLASKHRSESLVHLRDAAGAKSVTR